MNKKGRSKEVPTVEDVLARWAEERGLEAGQRTAVYVSTPITSGRRFIDWRKGEGCDLVPGTRAYVVGHRSEVILPNTQAAAQFIELHRWRQAGLLIDPTAFEVDGWAQDSYHEFWLDVLERYVRRVIVRDGWEFSRGCTLEYLKARELGLDCVDENLRPVTKQDAIALLEAALEEAQSPGSKVSHIVDALERLSSSTDERVTVQRELYKDEVLDHLANTSNVAQFVSFAPGPSPEQRYSRIRGFQPNHVFESAKEAISAVLAKSPDGMVNIRSFDPLKPEDNPFIQNQTDPGAVLRQVLELAGEPGLYTIVNETINVSDGGVSGVSHRGLIEFAPDDTPRCVGDPKKDTCAVPFDMGMRLLRDIYGFDPDLGGREGARVEFSIHPQPRGLKRDHTIIWQVEQRPGGDYESTIQWPNDMSRFLGDKAFGLALASAAGLPVPRCLVVGKRLFPWVFGRPTGSGAFWTRCCPAEKVAGHYPTTRGWHDPDEVLRDPWILDPSQRPEEPHATPMVAVLVQAAIVAAYSGRAKPANDGVRIGGVVGEGDLFMKGEEAEVPLPTHVCEAVHRLYDHAVSHFGPVELEWVFDGVTVWIVQMNAPRQLPREEMDLEQVGAWEMFEFGPGKLEEFRRAVIRLQGTGKGVVVIGQNVSPLSHLGEIAEVHNVPAKFIRTPSQSPQADPEQRGAP